MAQHAAVPFFSGGGTPREVAFIDSTGTVIATPTVGHAPEGICALPDASKLYCANWSDGTVSVLDGSAHTVLTTITLGALGTQHPYSIAALPDGSKVYVYRASDGVNPNYLDVIDTASDTLTTSILLSATDSSEGTFAMMPDGSKIYVASYSANTIDVVDTTTDTITSTISDPSLNGPYLNPVQPNNFQPDGSYLYVANDNSSGTDAVSTVDTATDTVVHTLTVGSGFPYPVVVLPDGSKAYLPNDDDNTVSVLDLSTPSTPAFSSTVTITGGQFCNHAVVTPDGSKVYVAVAASGLDLVGVINTTSDTLTTTITVGNGVDATTNPGIAVSLDGALVLACNFADGTASLIATSSNTVIATPTVNPQPNQPVFYGVVGPAGSASIDIDTGTPTATVTPVGDWTIPNSLQLDDSAASIVHDTGWSLSAGDSVIAVLLTDITTPPSEFAISSPGGTWNTIDEVTNADGYLGMFYATSLPSGDLVVTITNPASPHVVEYTLIWVSGAIGVDAIAAVADEAGATLIPSDPVSSSQANDLYVAAAQPGVSGIVGSGPSGPWGSPYPGLGGAGFVTSVAWFTQANAVNSQPTTDWTLEGPPGPHQARMSVSFSVPLILAPASGSATIDIDTGTPTPTTFPSGTIVSEVATTVVAGDPGVGFARIFAPTPPEPVPGPFGNHDYEVVVCDRYGIAAGVIPSAVPTQIDYVLDGIGTAMIDFWIQDPHAPTLLPLKDIPGVREIQIWRDQVLIFWGWPTSATWDSTQVHLTVSNLLWPFSQRTMGPEHFHFMTNPQFEEGLTGWTPSSGLLAAGGTAEPETTTVLLGKGAARLICPTQLEDAYLFQNVVVDRTGAPGFAFALAAWVYLDANYVFTGPAIHQRGLYMTDQAGNFAFVEIPATFPTNVWTRMEVQPTSSDGSQVAFIAPANEVTTFTVQLYCPGGSVVWDDVALKVYENISSPPGSPPATAWDVFDIIETLVISAQLPLWGQSDMAITVYGAETGVMLNRIYEVQSAEVFLDALNEFPTIGVCDFEVVWDATGHFRGVQVYAPAKGALQYNYPLAVSDPPVTTDLQGAVDGAQVGTMFQIIGQGSTGPSRDAGFASFASYLGGRVATDGGFTVGSTTVTSATLNFTAADVGVNIYSLNGALSPETYIVAVVNSSTVTVSDEALLTLTDETIGVGGVTVDKVQSALVNQPVSTLQGTAEGLLVQNMLAPSLPAPKVRADGPTGMFGRVEVGDVIPVTADYGWVQIPFTLMRIAKLTLYPPTEELQINLMQLNTPVSVT